MSDEEDAGLGPLPVLHPRERLVRDAENELRGAVLDIIKKYALTTGEILQVVTSVLSAEVLHIAKYAVRHERHPGNPDKPGGLA